MTDLSDLSNVDLELLIQIMRLRIVLAKIQLNKVEAAIRHRKSWGKDYPEILVSEN